MLLYIFYLFLLTEMSKFGEAGGKMRTNEFTKKHRKNRDKLKERCFNNRNSSSVYCLCQVCIKCCDYREYVLCIDPFLMDMRHTYWIYYGLVMASKTERAICRVTPDNIQEKQEKKKRKASRK